MMTMQWIRFFHTGACLLAGTLIALSAKAQLTETIAEFEAKAVTMRNEEDPNSGRLDLYVQIPFSKLEFIGGVKGFTAQYSIKAEISVLDKEGRPLSVIQAPVWEQSVTVPFYAQTQSDSRFDLTTQTITLDPGRYLIAVQLSDKRGRKNFFKEILAYARSFDEPLGLSDIVLLDAFDEQEQILTPRITPDISADVAEMQFYYEVYADIDQTLIFAEELLSEPIPMAPPEVSFKTLHASKDTVQISAGRHHRVGTIPVSDLVAGNYLLRVSMRDTTGRERAAVEQPVAARWGGLTAYVQRLDEAITQLAYVASGRELGKIRRAESEADRLRLFQEFWEKRDPTPGTARNERMEEHYYRIDYANRNFGHNTPGWLTDRGQVFVLHGHPEDVQRQVYSYNNRPWEVWYFYSIGRQFVFVDKTGFGDYELVVPIWDERTRLD